jgi:hypothetical protein
MNRASYKAIHSSEMSANQGNSDHQPDARSAFNMKFILLKKRYKLLILTNYLPLDPTTMLNVMLRFVIGRPTMA